MFFGQVKYTLGIVIASSLWLACASPAISAIPINPALSDFFDTQELNEYQDLIKQSVNGDAKALIKLIKFDCGGASFCYSHGEVLAKVTYELGESKVATFIGSMNKEDRLYFRHLLRAGLEYGSFTTDRNTTTKNGNLKIENEFPILNQTLQTSKN